MATKPRYRIGFVVDDTLDKPDGVQQYVLTLGKWLSGQGHEVHYLVGESVRTDIANVHSLSKNVRVSFNGNKLSIPLLSSKRKLRQLLSEYHFDILHVQVPYHPLMAARLVKLAPADTGIFGTFHIAPNSGTVFAGTYLLGLYLQRNLRHFDGMVSVSPAAQAFARSTFHVRTTILPNAIEYSKFNRAKPLPAYTDDVPTILFLGRLVPRKGSLLLLKAIAMLKESEPELSFRVIICGKGSLSAKLELFVRQHNLQDIVELKGFISEEDKPHYYASADLAVFPSTGGESFGIVLTEALASGRAAVLAGDNPGYRSVMHPHEELLFKPHDTAAFADILSRYLHGVTLRQTVAKWGAAYSRSFDVNVVGQQLLQEYAAVLRKRREG